MRVILRSQIGPILFVYLLIAVLETKTDTARAPLSELTVAQQRVQLFDIAYQSQGHWFANVVEPIVSALFQIETAGGQTNLTTTMATHTLVVESVPSFQASDEFPCKYSEEYWMQVVGEPGKNYDDDAWCPHAKKPILRMDTVIQDRKSPSCVWVPYACNYVIPNKSKLSNRQFRDFHKRPHLLAWISSNCVHTRVDMWRALKREAHKRQVDGLHSLGKCEAYENLENDSGWWSNDAVYSKYKFVLTMENTVEPGYVSEKIATALAAGAIPVYYGDTRAARSIFNESSFIALTDLWDTLGISKEPEEFTRVEWDRTARALIDLMTDNVRVNSFFIRNSLAVHTHVLEPYDELLPSTCITYRNNGENRLREIRDVLDWDRW